MKLKRWRGALAVCLMMGLIAALAVMMTGFSDANADDGASEGVPRIYISLNDVTLEEINDGDKDAKYGGNELVLWDGDTESYFEDVEIKGRGNITWKKEKKPYQIKFAQKVDFLGMGKARKWVLIAGYLDHSAIRTDLAFYLAHEVNPDYQMDGRFVELYFDQEYIGLYYATKAVEVDKNVVDLKDPEGVLVELDNAYCLMEDYSYRTFTGDCLTVKDLVNKDNFDIAFSNFVKDFEEFQKAAMKKDYEKIREIVDADSLAEYYLLSEFIGNLDAYITSFYFYKDGVSDKIHVGPAWDFDGAFGNLVWKGMTDEITAYSPETIEPRRSQAFENDDKKEATFVSKTVFEVSELPEFQELVCQKFQDTLLSKKIEIMGHIDSDISYIDGVARLDNNKWGFDDFDESVYYLADWMTRRFDTFEKMCLPKVDSVAI